MVTVRNLLDVASLLLIITSAAIAYKCGNTSAIIGWIVAAIWLIRCKLTELV